MAAKILLLTDTPPRRDASGSLVLDQLCRFLPEGALCCYVVLNWYQECAVTDDLHSIPLKSAKKPIDYYGRLTPEPLGRCASYLMEKVHSLWQERWIARDVVRFAREQGVTRLWCVLEGQTMIRLARPVARALGVPLLSLVWDPPEWGLRASQVHPRRVAQILREYGEVLAASDGCAAASTAMAREYRARYGVRSLPVIASLPRDLARPPARALRSADRVVVGVAGQLYSSQEWGALLAALDDLQWTLCGRDVEVRLLGKHEQPPPQGVRRIVCLGWCTQEEAVLELSRCDILYCPYWFDPAFETEARLCFPSKLTTYLATGTPVLFHGPRYASPASFLEEHGAGEFCFTLEPGEIAAALTRMVGDRRRYAELAANGHRAFLEHFTLEAMRENFYTFLGIPDPHPPAAPAPPRHGAEAESAAYGGAAT